MAQDVKIPSRVRITGSPDLPGVIPVLHEFDTDEDGTIVVYVEYMDPSKVNVKEDIVEGLFYVV